MESCIAGECIRVSHKCQVLVWGSVLTPMCHAGEEEGPEEPELTKVETQRMIRTPSGCAEVTGESYSSQLSTQHVLTWTSANLRPPQIKLPGH